MDGNPIRDNGPYRDAEHARAALAETMANLPNSTPAHQRANAAMQLGGAVLDLDLSEYERHQVHTLAEQLDSAQVQVIAGWLMRARITAADAVAGLSRQASA